MAPKKPVEVTLNDGQRRVDFILVYEFDQSDYIRRQRKYFEKNLQQEGLILEMDTNDGDDMTGKICFVKVHAPWETLCRGAEMLQMKAPLRNSEQLSEDHNDTSDSNNNHRWVYGKLFSVPYLSSLFIFNEKENILLESSVSKHITAQFTRSRIEQFLVNDEKTFFSSTQRIRIVYDVMQRAKCDPDDNKKRGLQWLLKNDVFLAAYPPHDGGTEIRHLDPLEKSQWSQRQILRYTWANFNRMFKPQPLHLIRSYFGEKVGFYFAWLGFYTQMLIFPSIVGLLSFLYGIFSLPSNPIQHEICDNSTSPGNLTMCPVCRMPMCDPWPMHTSCESAEWNYRFDHESHIFVAMFTLLWATVFLELWKRKEAELAYKWDAYDVELDDIGTRPEYEIRAQSQRVSPVTNEEEPFVPSLKRFLWLLQSLSGLMFLILLVIAGLIGLIVVRILLYGLFKNFGGVWFKLQFEFASLAIHVLTFVVVMTLGWVYEKAARRLTELECPRTQSDYLASYTWKVFIFELLNNFAPIFYAALIRGRNLSVPSEQSWLQEMCDPGGCLNEVVQAIGILLLARLLISNAAELGVPLLKSVWKDMRMGASVGPDKDEPTIIRNLPRWQKDYTLNEPDLDGVYAEYLEMMVQFGYVTLFVAAFPLAPLICLLNNIVEIRLDATNFVTAFRRPMPIRVSGIRIWRRCLNVMVKLAVLCNGGFLAFTSEMIPQLVYRYAYSPDGTARGYVRFTLAKFNTTTWAHFYDSYPDWQNITHCYYRDYREDYDPQTPKIVWWQIMVARLAFFIIFVITFYFIQWLCDFLVPDVPHHIKVRLDRANFMARKAMYGNDPLKNGPFHSDTSLVNNHDSSKLNGGLQETTDTNSMSDWKHANGSPMSNGYAVIVEDIVSSSDNPNVAVVHETTETTFL